MRTFRRLDQAADRLVTELRLVFLRDLRGDLVRGRRIDEQTAAAAESAARQARSVDLGNRLRGVHDRIKLFAGVLEPVAARLLGVVHQSAEALEVALLEERRALKDALVLADRVNGALGGGLAETAAVEDPLAHRHVPEVRHRLAENAREVLRRILARLAARRI